jgi:hypothetical protein
MNFDWCHVWERESVEDQDQLYKTIYKEIVKMVIIVFLYEGGMYPTR